MSYTDYAARGANSFWRYLLGVLAGTALFVVIAVVLVVATMVIARVPAADMTVWFKDPGRPVSFFGSTAVTFAVLLSSFVLAIRLFHGKRFTDVIGAWSWRRFGLGFGVWAGVLGLGVLVDILVAPKGFRFSANGETPLLAAMALAALAVQTFTEEFIFRGYLTQGLILGLRRPLPAAVISGLLFGALHIPNGGPQAASAVFFGIALALIAMRTGGIAFTYGLHLANNLVGAVVVVSGGDVFHGAPGIFTQDTPQLMWWDAGVGDAMLAVVAVMVYRSFAAPKTGPTEPDAVFD